MEPMKPMQPMKPMGPLGFPDVDARAEWGTAASSGGQNDMHYAFFPKARRVVIERGGVRTVYDTAGHDISGMSQDQSDGPAHRIVFTGRGGVVPVDSLAIVDE